jgi:uncharacterized membrane protein HdeD (DUF308 family)
MEADSVPLDAAAAPPSKKNRGGTISAGNVKLIVALFFIFMLVVSSTFTEHIVAGFGEKAVQGRNPTSWGVVLQGIFLVIFYILAMYLVDHGIF